MYLMRIGPAGSERPVVLIDDLHYIDVADVVDDFNEAFFGSEGLTRLGSIVRERGTAGQLREFAGERIGAPIARPHQILCIGLNYSDHAAETDAAIPEEPILFTKSPNTLIGPNDDVRIPRGSTKLDWEVELGVVIGRRTSYLDSAADAHDAIAGYLVVNDVSERAFQIERGGQWSKGKSAETFNPAGPCLVTPDEIDDVLKLRMWLDQLGAIRVGPGDAHSEAAVLFWGALAMVGDAFALAAERGSGFAAANRDRLGGRLSGEQRAMAETRLVVLRAARS